MQPSPEPKKIVERLLLYSATLSIVVLIILNFLLFGPPSDALRLLLPSVLASLVAVLLIYVLRQVLFHSTDRFLTQNEVNSLSVQIAEELKLQLPSTGNIHFYEKWNEVPWKDILADAQELEFFASYMDTWIIQAVDMLQLIFNKGGTIRAFLPKPGSDAAKRVVERFPEYTVDLITAKIENTVHKLQMMLKRSTNKRAKLEIFWTQTFCMHCLLRINKKYLILSPFDHFRHGQIDAPAFVIDLGKYPRLAEWAAQELRGFETCSERWVGSPSTIPLQSHP